MNTRSLFARLGLQLLLALVLLLFWNTFLVYPLKIFVVFLHELSHGLAAVMTGGTIEKIVLSFDEGGYCVTRGGSEFLILSAGYLGSLVWGSALLFLSNRTRWNRTITLLIGCMTLAITLLYVRSWFGLIYGMFAGVALILAGRKLEERYCRHLVSLLGTASCLYAVYDIASDVLARSIPGSDAHALSDLTGIPAIVWGVLWILIALFVAGLTLILAHQKRRRL